jgi:spore coat protein CotH
MRTTLLLSAFVIGLRAAAQAPSDSLFNVDQVVTVNLTFQDAGFWNTLTNFYTNGLGETLTADVTITDGTGTQTLTTVEVDLKGNSSYNHPGNKKSFKIDLNDNISGQKFHGLSKLHFNNCFGDPTLMREKIFFDHCREEGVLVPRVQYANIYMNGSFWGFYALVEAVDKDFLDRWVDNTSGNLFKAGDNFGIGGGAAADLKYYGADQTAYADRYELKTNSTENNWSDLLDLLDTLNNGTDSEVQATLPARFAWNDLLKSLALDNLFGNLDAYINSARNYYIYHDSTTLQWNWIHWDGNESFGKYPAMGVNAITLQPTYVATNRPLMTRITNIPALRLDYLNTYCALREQFTNDYLDPRIDSIKALIQDHVNADIHKQFTYAQFEANVEGDIQVQGGGGGGGMQTIYGLKSFITARNASLASSLDCSVAGIMDVEETSFVLSPNPCTNELRLQLPTDVTVLSVEAIDGLGRAVTIRKNQDRCDVSVLSDGPYMIRVQTQRGIVQGRVMKL